MAYAQEKAERCGVCGTAEWEWKENKNAYHASRVTCFGCQQRDLIRDDDDGKMPGVTITLLPGPSPIPERRQRKADE